MASKPEIADPPFKTKSAVWKYFGCPIRDGKSDFTQAICRICHKIIPRPASGSTSAMLGHLKTHHPDIHRELKKPHQQIRASTSNIDMEPMQEAEFSKVKNIMKYVDDKISQETELNRFLKERINDLEKSKMELVGVFGRTGAGKSSLINAVIGEKDLLPSGDISACTSVMIQVKANMINSKYIAEIEFILKEEWKDELWDYLKNRDFEKNEEGDTDDDDIKKKISALYGEDATKFTGVDDYMDKDNFKEIKEFLQSQKKILECNTSSDLSRKIAKYTRQDSEEETNTGKRYWPLVKCVTIEIPNASKLLQHVALVDLPGTGDRNKSRDVMWKKFVGACSAVWIVSDTIRADSDKDPWEILDQTISLIGNGGECRSISFICTKCDVIDDKYKKSKEDRRRRVLKKNETVKKEVIKTFKEKGVIKKHFSGDSDFFQVFTVTSKEFNRLKYLQEDETEIPLLQQFLKDLNDHQSKTNYYVSGANGILHLMKAANSPETGSDKADVCKVLKTRLLHWIDDVDQTMMKCKEAFERCLDDGVRRSQESCESILKGVTKGKMGHHSNLKSLVQNNGIYKKKENKRKTEVNLNERLSKHMRETIDQEFSKTFPNEGRPGPIKEAINKFTLDTDSLSDKHKGVALQMTFLKTEEEKLKIKLANVIREDKKNIYSSLTKSIQESMQTCYDKAAEHSGTGMVEKMKQEMQDHLHTSKYTMFVKAKECMLDEVECLKNKLLKIFREDMLTSIDQSLKTNDNSVPDVTEQYEEVKMIYYYKLKSSSRRSAYTGMKESTDSPSPSCLSMKSDNSMSPPINFKAQTWSPDLSSSEFSSSVLTTEDVSCCVCLSTMRDPVSIPCGHSYCKFCINKYWDRGDYVCPLCNKRYPVRPVLSVNVTLKWVLEALQWTASGQPALAQTGSGDVAWTQQEEVDCDVCSSLKPRAVKTCLTCSASYCENHLREHYSVPALQKHTLTPVNEDTTLSEQEWSTGRMGVNKVEPICEPEEHQGSACNRRKLAGEEEDEMFQHSSELRPEQSDLNTQVYTQTEPQQGGNIEMVSPASSPMQPQQDKPGDRHPQAEDMCPFDSISRTPVESGHVTLAKHIPLANLDGSLTDQLGLEACEPSLADQLLQGFQVMAGRQRREETCFSPIMHTEQTTIEYRFKFPWAGLFHCSLTRLKFKTTGEGEVLFRTVQWAERWLTGNTPAGPLFSIECPQESICQLHLPHCEITPGDDLSVAHITDEVLDEGVQFLKPVEVTKTHVVVNVTHLSFFGLLKKKKKPDPTPEPSFGQVLLFLRPPSDRLVLKVFLLPANVTVEEVKIQHKEDTYIDTTSDCVLTPKEVYSLHSAPHEVNPQESVPYRQEYGPNCHQTFEVVMALNTADVSLEVRGPEDKKVWQHPKLRVKGPSAPKRTYSSLSIPASSKHFVDQHRRKLIESVTNVESILEVLHEKGAITKEAYDKVASKRTNQEKMRELYPHLKTKNAKDVFCNGLREYEKDLLKELE